MDSAEHRTGPLRVLFLVHRYHDDGANGLALRMNQFVRHLDRERVSPWLMTVNATTIHEGRVREFYDGHVDECLAERHRGALETLQDRLTLAPWLLYREYPDLMERVRQRCREWKIDVIVETGGFLIANLDPDRLPAALTCDLIDSPIVSLERELANTSAGVARLKLKFRLAAARHYQSRCLARARFVAVTADADADAVARTNPGHPLLLIRNGVDTDFFSPGEGLPDAAELVFEGGMSYTPNVDAARHLVNDILPLIRGRHPDVRLWLVGKDPAPEVLALASDSVRVTGTVDDVRPYVRGARVFVCPMRLGAGIKNKILQAWSMGVPVVATDASLPGLDAEPGRHLLVGNDPASFADAVSSLLDDPGKAGGIAQAALRHVRAEFSWRQRSAVLVDAIEKAAGARGALRDGLGDGTEHGSRAA